MKKTGDIMVVICFVQAMFVFAFETPSVIVEVKPTDVFVRAGDMVTLNCTVTYAQELHTLPKSMWTLRGKSKELYLKQNEEYDCCAVTGNESTHKTYLIIKQVSTETSGKWDCVNTNSSSATVIMIDPGDPVCEGVGGIGQKDEVIENSHIKLKCAMTTLNITTLGNLVWYKNGHELSRGNFPLVVTTKITRADHGTPFSCRLEHINSSSSVSCLRSIVPDVQYPPQVTTPSSVCVKEGSMLMIRCEYVPGNPTLTAIQWNIAGRETTTNKNPLIIENVTSAKHSGVYTCKVYNTYFNGEHGENLNHTAVHVEYGPKVETLPVQRVRQGDDTSLKCNAKADPDADMFQWITPSGSVMNGQTITLKNVQISDKGIYNCTARNTFCDEIGGYGHGSNYTYLDILYRSEKVLQTGNKAMKAEGFLTLTCTTSHSNPASTIIWYKNGSPLQVQVGAIDITTITEESSGHSGFITKDRIRMKLKPEDNAAKIQCSAKNPDFHDAFDVFSNKIILSVSYPPNQPKNCSTQLTILDNGNEMVAHSLLTLQCTSCSSNPPADISWYMDHDVLKSTHQAGQRQGHFNGIISEEKLQINLTYEYDGRSVHCVATNQNFTGQTYESRAIDLDVQYEPVPIGEGYNRRAAVSVGESAALQCRMKGNPSPSIQWYDQHGSQLAHGDSRRYVKEDIRNLIQKSTLNIYDVIKSDYGKYYCRGQNKHGHAEIVIVLSGKSAPDAVSNIKIGITADIVTVNWTPGFNGGNDQKFYVEYVKLPGGVKETTALINANELGDTSSNISGLVSGASYNITVVSVNDHGENRSRTITVRAEGKSKPVAEQLDLRVYIIIIGIVIVAAVMVVMILLVIKNHKKKTKVPREPGREMLPEDLIEMTPLQVEYKENDTHGTRQVSSHQDIRHQFTVDKNSTYDMIKHYENVPIERRFTPPFFTNGEEHLAAKHDEETKVKSTPTQIQPQSITSNPASSDSQRKSSTEDEDISSYALLQNPAPSKGKTWTRSNSPPKSKAKTKYENINKTVRENERRPYENVPSRGKIGNSREAPKCVHEATPLRPEEQSHCADGESDRGDSDSNPYENMQGISGCRVGDRSTASDSRPELPRKKPKANVERLIYADLEHFRRKEPHTGRRRERKSDPVQYATIDHAKTSQMCREQRAKAEQSDDENASYSSDNN